MCSNIYTIWVAQNKKDSIGLISKELEATFFIDKFPQPPIKKIS